ncbi:galactosyltransferase-related protein [Thermomonas sp.]|uniref:glycosyltransferase family 2 protein n=1 Tax=Thermomonas sp. TaxID=1971895 RepID=UPI002487118F|nr:galactosyltransferase-related protein [Thermomonas sp.]MDI1253511.1 galactosyltransferase-related protein [Thermomonas sp.]
MDSTVPTTDKYSEPTVSVVIGVRGTARLEQFKACIKALRSQIDVSYEVIVVEQSWHPAFASIVPKDVIYVHQKCTSQDMPYNRSWALNRGAREAKGRILLLHDADMLLPKAALSHIVGVIDRGLEAVRLPRLIFYLDAESSEEVQRGENFFGVLGLERIIANNRTPIAVTKECYFSIGGHDERFYGWGAEDDEFMERLRTRNIGEGARLPIVHLWHESAANDDARERNALLLDRLSSTPTRDRIASLRNGGTGAEVPSSIWSRS